MLKCACRIAVPASLPRCAIKTYDLYLFTADGKVISGWHSFDAADDREALAIAEGLVQLPPAELWQGGTLVKQWEKSR